MEVELPEDLKIAQEKINKFYKEEELKQQIGKYYSAHRGYGFPVALRRIFLDKNNNIRVDEYYVSKPEEETTFEFKTYIITEAVSNYNTSNNWSEIEGKIWYECLKRFLNIDALKIGEEIYTT